MSGSSESCNHIDPLSVDSKIGSLTNKIRDRWRAEVSDVRASGDLNNVSVLTAQNSTMRFPMLQNNIMAGETLRLSEYSVILTFGVYMGGKSLSPCSAFSQVHV